MSSQLILSLSADLSDASVRSSLLTSPTPSAATSVIHLRCHLSFSSQGSASLTSFIEYIPSTMWELLRSLSFYVLPIKEYLCPWSITVSQQQIFSNIQRVSTEYSSLFLEPLLRFSRLQTAHSQLAMPAPSNTSKNSAKAKPNTEPRHESSRALRRYVGIVVVWVDFASPHPCWLTLRRHPCLVDFESPASCSLSCLIRFADAGSLPT